MNTNTTGFGWFSEILTFVCFGQKYPYVAFKGLIGQTIGPNIFNAIPKA